MYEIIYLLNQYDGPTQGICQRGKEFYYFDIDPETLQWSNRRFYVYKLPPDGSCNIVMEGELNG